jgi:hypothetical protein
MAPTAPRRELRTRDELARELRSLFPRGIDKRTFGEQLRRNMKRDAPDDALQQISGLYFWRDRAYWSAPQLSSRLRHMWR